MKSKIHILFTSTFDASFISNDLESLRKKYDVTAIGAHGLPALIRYFRALLSTDLTFSWFASVHSSLLVFLARRRRMPSVIVVGGADVAQEKEFNYGVWNSWWRSRIVRYGITHASMVLCVDEFLKNEAKRLANYDGSNLATIPTGFDTHFFSPAGQKDHIVLTVGACPDMARIKKKGIDVLLDVAQRMPETKFIIVGIAQSISPQLVVPVNVELHPLVSKQELLNFYRRSKVYCQPSRHEGLPSTLCEAMLCECIPVGSRVAGIPNAVGETGFLVERENVEQTVRALEAALKSGPELGRKARIRIAKQFSPERRAEALYTIIDHLCR